MPTATDSPASAVSGESAADTTASARLYGNDTEGDPGIELVRPLAFGNGVAPGTRIRLQYPGERFEPFLKLDLTEPDGPSFIVVEPGRLFDDYLVAIPEEDVELLELTDAADAVIFVLVTTTHTPPTVNLNAPIVVNWRTKRGVQAILDESGYSYAVPIGAGTARP